MFQVRLDDEILAQLERVGGKDLIAELCRLYLANTPERVERTRRALARGDLDAAGAAVHSLRSSSATLGATELAAALGEVEAAAVRGDAAVVGRRWPKIEEDVAGLLVQLAEGPGEE